MDTAKCVPTYQDKRSCLTAYFCCTILGIAILWQKQFKCICTRMEHGVLLWFNWQLAVGSWQLAVGSWQLAVGSWQLAVGSWQLAVGKIVNSIFVFTANCQLTTANFL
jgi:hypothetical protein